MNKNLRFETVSRSFLAVACFACAAVACTTQEAKPAAAGGSSGSVGGHVGTAGSGAGGSGSVAACGTGPYAPLPGTVCPLPGQMITNFTYDPDAGSTEQVRFGTVGTTLSGGESSYSNLPGGTVTGNVTQNDWHIMGTVGNYSGFNIYFDTFGGCNMIDASAYDGITFTIWGTVGQTASVDNKITMGVGIVDDSPAPSWYNSIDAGSATPTPGSCIPTSGNGPYYHPGCGDPTNVFGVTGTQASPQTVAIHWTDFTLGTCKPNVLPNQILSIYWQFPWPGAGGVPYDVDIHIDDMAFIPKP